MDIVADLHMHSTCSDGKHYPEEIYQRVINAGLTAFALSDHDTLSHIPKINRCIADNDNFIKFIPAVEISCEHRGDLVHILAYNVSQYSEEFINIFQNMNKERKAVILKMGAKLKELGYNIDYTSINENTETPGRPHLAKQLVEGGYFKTFDEVFNTLLGHGKPAYVKKAKPSAEFIITKISEYKGISVLAHPGIYNNLHKVKYIQELNVDGVEVFHPAHDFKQNQYYLEYAQTNNLLITGGSDFHGWEENDSREIGSFGLNAEYFQSFLDFIN